MSRIGRAPITIPAGVTFTFEGHKAVVTGPKGTLEYALRPEMTLEVVDSQILVSIKRETKQTNAFWGLTRALIANMIVGVTQGFEKKLELVGVGYRVTQSSPSQLSITVGYSHPVEFDIPEGIEVELDGNKFITIKGIDKQKVGLVSSNIRKIRKPEPYKGKGIKYVDEVILRKPGKSGKF